MRIVRYIGLLGALVFGSFFADVSMVHVQKKFQRIKKEHSLIVAFAYSLSARDRAGFADEDGEKTYSQRWHAVENVVEILDSFSNRSKYSDSVAFIAINFDRGDLSELRQELGLTQDAILFFKDGVPLVTQIIDAASFSPADMRRFLERANISDFAEYVNEERIAKKKKERELRRRASAPLVSFGVGLGYGCAYPWRSGCVSPASWGWGRWGGYWGRGCCW